MTYSATYVITVNNWNALQAINNQYTGGAQAFNAAFQTLINNYENNYPNATSAEAGEYALLQTFGNAINLYSAGSGSTTYDLHTLSNGIVVQPCP